MGGADWFKDAIIYHILIDRFAGFKSTEGWDKPIFFFKRNSVDYLKGNLDIK